MLTWGEAHEVLEVLRILQDEEYDAVYDALHGDAGGVGGGKGEGE
jgi:hypothetical protein